MLLQRRFAGVVILRVKVTLIGHQRHLASITTSLPCGRRAMTSGCIRDRASFSMLTWVSYSYPSHSPEASSTRVGRLHPSYPSGFVIPSGRGSGWPAPAPFVHSTAADYEFRVPGCAARGPPDQSCPAPDDGNRPVAHAERQETVQTLAVLFVNAAAAALKKCGFRKILKLFAEALLAVHLSGGFCLPHG